MIRRLFRIGLLLGALGGIAFALSKLLANQSADALAARTPQPWPRLESDPTAPPKPAAKDATTWVEATGGVCPSTHPVKAKMSSKIFHLPGMTNYERTNPDRCYTDAASAEADGLRPAKR